MKEIQLTQNQVALVDDEDYDYLNQWKWYASYSKDINNYYAARNTIVENSHKTILMHRVIMNPQKERLIDHIDHNTLNNQKSNLRIVTHSQNNQNQRMQKGKSSKYKGVHWNKEKQKWQARIKINYKIKHLGYFETEDDAYKAYCKAAQISFGEFAYTELELK